MRKIFILLAITFLNYTVAQTKSESEEWITEKYNYYERVNNSNMNFDLYFEDNYLYYNYIGLIIRVKVKDITKIEIRQEYYNNEDKVGWTSIFIHFAKGKSQTKRNENDEFKIDSIDSNFKIPLSSDLIKDGYKSRMEKAFLHLVKLNGGNAIVKKEAF